MFLTSPYLGLVMARGIKIQLQIAKFLTCFVLKLHVKRGLNSLIFLIGFEMLKI